MQITKRSPDDLTPHPDNPRTHPDRALRKLKASIESFGWTNPILATEDGTVLAGHARLKAARDLGRDTVPVITLDLEGADAEAYMLADNRIHEETAWDEEQLKALLQQLDHTLSDWTRTGFDDGEIESLLENVPADDELQDEVAPAPPEDPVTQPGDLWQLGEHRLICGDATDPQVHGRLLEGREPALCVTDPPYGVNVDHGWRDGVKNRTPSPRSGTLEGDDEWDWRDVYELLTAPVTYVWHASTHGGEVKLGLESAGYEVRQQIVWVKDVHALSRSHYHWKHEPCWYAVREGATARWRGGRSQTTVWEHASPIMHTPDNRESTDHPTQKPLAVYTLPIRNHTHPGDVLIDPFAGSGTALSACEQLDRIFRGIEIDPRWCDVLVERWEHLTGHNAQRTPQQGGVTS